MIAGGTGIAPFKAFLEERMTVTGTGPMELFYGVRDESEYVYKDLIEQAQARGTLTALHLGLEPVRCDQLLKDNAKVEWSWCNNQSIIK